MGVIEKYKKSLITCLLLAIFAGLIYLGIDIVLFEFSSIMISYEFDRLLEYFIQITVLLVGLYFYPKIEPLSFINLLKKRILITALYAFFIGEFHSMIYPASKPPTLFDKLILNLEHSWIIITIGFGFALLKYIHQRLKNETNEII